MENLLDIFERLAFPVAVSVTLFAILIYFVKRALAMISTILKDNETRQKEYIDHLKTSNAKLVAVVEDNTEIIKKFSYLLERYMKSENK